MPYFSMELIYGGNLASHFHGFSLPHRGSAALGATLDGASGIIPIKKASSPRPRACELLVDIESGTARIIPTYSSAGRSPLPVVKFTDVGPAKQIDESPRRCPIRRDPWTPSYCPGGISAAGEAIGHPPTCMPSGSLYELLTCRRLARAPSSFDTSSKVVHAAPSPCFASSPACPSNWSRSHEMSQKDASTGY